MIRRPLRKTRNLRKLASDREGVTVIEFAIVGPVLILMIMGLFDIAHTQYTSSVLHGAMQKAARDLTLEAAASRQVNIDARVRDQVAEVMPNDATITMKKYSHFDFSDVKNTEEIIDLNGDGICNPMTENFIDTNENGRLDERGKDGIGGARDVVLYQAIVTYPRLFPLYTMIGLPKNVTVTAATVLRNQPFDEQKKRVTTTAPCPSS